MNKILIKLIPIILCVLCVFVVNNTASADVLTINGTASLTLENQTAITVTGTITGTGTLACTASSDIYISGDWGIATFSQANSTVYFDDTTAIASTANNHTFYNLNISGNAIVTTSSTAGLSITNALTLAQYGSLDLGSGLTHNIPTNSTISGTLNLRLSNLTPNGNLIIASNGVLNMNGTSPASHPQLTMANGTTLQIDGTLNNTWSSPNLKPIITSTGTAARYSFTVNGKIDANGLVIASTDANGLTINATADKASDLDNVDFQNTASGGRHLYIGFTSGNYVGNYDTCSFDQSFGVGAGYNVVCANTSGTTTLYFTNWQSGNGGGSQYHSQGTNTTITWINSNAMVAASPASVVIESTAAITVPGDFNIDILTCTGPASVYVTGAWNVITFSAGTSTVYFNGGTQNIALGSGTNSFYNLVVSSSDANTAPGSNVVIAPNGSLTVAPQSSSVSGNYTLDNKAITFGNAASLNVNSNAKLKAYNNTIITTPNPGTDRFSFNIDGEIELDNCSITSTTTNGLNIGASATIDAINNVKFYNHPGGSGRFMTITTPNLDIDFRGCWFDTITSGYNISATGTASVIRFELYNAGPGAGRTYTYDNDTNNDGVAENGGAVVLWLEKSMLATESAGGIQGFPTVAFDLNNYAYYSTYVVSRDISGTATADRLYVLDSNGNQKYYYDINQKYGDIVSTPWWYTEGPITNSVHTVYFGTTAGYLFRLIDTGTALTLSPGWPIKVCTEITSAVITDGINLYFGGMDGTQPKIFAYVISSGSLLFALGDPTSTSRITATPSWAIHPTTNHTCLFIGSDYQALTSNSDLQITNGLSYVTSTSAGFQANGVGPDDVLAITSGTQQGRYRIVSVDSETRVTVSHTFTATETSISYSAGQTPLIYRVDVTDKVIDKQNNSAFDHLRTPTVYWERQGTRFLFAGDYYGRMQGVDPFTTNLDNLTGTWPAIPSYGPYSITAMATVLYWPPIRIVYADMGGWFYDLNQDGTLYNPGSSYPFQPGGNTAIQSSPLAASSGLIYIGNNDGKVFVINEATRSVSKTYSFGSGMIIGDISRDPDNNLLLVPTSTGKVFYLSE